MAAPLPHPGTRAPDPDLKRGAKLWEAVCRERGKDRELSKRRQPSAAGKARVALEAVQRQKTVHAIAQEYQVHPVQVSQGKKERLERLPEVFGRKVGPEAGTLVRQKKRLERKVGELTMDLEFLKKCGPLGIVPDGRP